MVDQGRQEPPPAGEVQLVEPGTEERRLCLHGLCPGSLSGAPRRHLFEDSGPLRQPPLFGGQGRLTVGKHGL